MEQEYKYMVATRCFTFNHAPYIEDAMNGFAMQETSFPVITIIVDDASTDGEPEVIRKYLAEHFHSPYRTEETEYAHIICAKHKTNANCDFVVFLLKYNHYSIKKDKFPYLSEWLDNAKYHALCEGDDYWIEKKKLEKQVSYMEHHPRVGMVYAKCKYYYQSKKKFSKYNWGGSAVTFDDLFLHNTVPFASVLYRRPLLESYNNAIKPKDKHWMLGDYPFWLYISKQSELYFIDETFSVYRVLLESASHSTSFEKSDAFLRSLFEMKLYFCEYYNLGCDLHDYKYKSLAVNAIKYGRRDKCHEYLNKIKVKDYRIKALEFLSRNTFVFTVVAFFYKMKF